MNDNQIPSAPDHDRMPIEDIPLIPREEALDAFKALLLPAASERVLNVYGDGGRGKTWFLKSIQKHCQAENLLYNKQIIDFYDTTHHRVSGLMASIIQELDPDRKFFGPYFEFRDEFDRLRAQGQGGRALEPLGKKMDCAFLRGLRDLGRHYRRADGSPGVVLLLDTFEVIREGRVGRWVLEKMLGEMEDLCSKEKNPPPVIAAQDIVVVLAARPPEIDQKQTPAPIRYCEPGDFTAQEVEQYVRGALGRHEIEPADPALQPLAAWIYAATGGHPVQVALALDLAHLYIATHGAPALTGGGLLRVLQDIRGAAKNEQGGVATALVEQIMDLLGQVPEQQWAVLYMAHLRRRFTPRMYAWLMGRPPTDLKLVNAFSAFEKLYMTKYRHLRGTFRLPPEKAQRFQEATVSLHDLIRDWVYKRYWQGSIPLIFIDQARRAGILPEELGALWEQVYDREGKQAEVPHARLQKILRWLDDQAVAFYEDRRRRLKNEQKEIDREQDPTAWVEYEYQQHALMAEQLLYEMDRDLEAGWRKWRQVYYEAFEAYQSGYCEQLELTVLSAWPEDELETDPRKREIREMAHVRQLWWKIQRSGPKREEAIQELEEMLRREPVPIDWSSEMLADVHAALGWAYDLEGRLRRSLRHRERAAELFRRLDRPWDLALALDFLGRTYHLLDSFPQADAAWQEAVDIALDLGDQYRLASVAMKWGHSLNVRGELGRALGYAQVAVRVFRSLGDERSLGLALNYLGRIYIAQGKFTHAGLILREAQIYTERFGGPADLVQLKRTWGEFHRRRAQAEKSAQVNDFDLAQQVLEDARRQAQEEELGHWEVEAGEELGALYRDRARRAVEEGDLTQAKMWWAKAEPELRAALAAYEREQSWFKVADLLDDLCEMYETQHQAGVNGQKELEEHLDRLAEIADRHDFPRYRSRVAEMRARLAWEAERYEEAVRHYVDACAYAGLHTRAGETFRTSYDRLVGELEEKLESLSDDAQKVDLARKALQRWGYTGQVAAHPQFTQACHRVIYPAQARLDEQKADATFAQGWEAYERNPEEARPLFEEAFRFYVRACDQTGRLTDASHRNYLQYMDLVSKLERRFYDLPDMNLVADLSAWVASEWQRLEQAVRHPAVLEVCRRAEQMAQLASSLLTG